MQISQAHITNTLTLLSGIGPADYDANSIAVDNARKANHHEIPLLCSRLLPSIAKLLELLRLHHDYVAKRLKLGASVISPGAGPQVCHSASRQAERQLNPFLGRPRRDCQKSKGR